MQVYAVSGLTRRQQAWQLLALAAAREWGLSPLPGAAWTPEGKPFSPVWPAAASISATAARWLCAPWTASRWGRTSR